MRGLLYLIAFLEIGTLCGQGALRNSLPEVQVVGRSDEAFRLTRPGGNEVLTLPSDVLRTSAIPSVADLLRQQAGVNFTSFFGSAGTGSPQLRGFGEGASTRVLILVAGLPMTRPDLAGPVWFEFPLAGLERIELQRGSRTVRYGSSALAGVISLETRRDVVNPEWSLQTSSGSWNANLVRLNGLIPNKHGWIGGTSFDAFESDGYRQNSAIDSHALQLSLSSPKDRGWQWQSTFNASETTLENPGGLSTNAYLTNPRQSVFARFGIGDQYQNSLTSLRLAQQVRFQPAPNHLWQLNASWSGRERELNFGAGSHTDHDLDRFAFDLSHEWSCSRHSVSWGIRGTYDTLFLERFRDQARRDRFATADLDRRAIGLFTRADYRFQKGWTLSGGVSWDTYKLEASVLDSDAANNPLLSFSGDTKDSAWGAELSLEYQPSRHTRFWARYDQVFRFPVLDEIAGYQGFILATPINTNLQPETGHGIEFGGRFEDDRLSASLTVFAQWLDGEILFDFNENLNTNFADSRRLGIESRLTYRVQSWQALLNYQWVDARFTSGRFSSRAIPLVPAHQLSAGVIWQPHKLIELGLEWEWLSSSFEGGDFSNTAARLPGRSLVNFEGRFAFSESLEVYGRIDNLFDERWATLKFLGQWYPGNGRGITIGIRSTF